jgi:DNA-binding NtrC family response regulator
MYKNQFPADTLARLTQIKLMKGDRLQGGSKPSTRHIIMIDRDHIRREAERKALRSEGFEAITFECGKDATRHLLVNSTEGAVVDLGSAHHPLSAIPDGKRIVQEIMEINAFLPLVLISDQKVVLDYETIAAADIVLQRPVNTIQLKNALNAVLSESLRERTQRKSRYIYAFR